MQPYTTHNPLRSYRLPFLYTVFITERGKRRGEGGLNEKDIYRTAATAAAATTTATKDYHIIMKMQENKKNENHIWKINKYISIKEKKKKTTFFYLI